MDGSVIDIVSEADHYSTPWKVILPTYTASDLIVGPETEPAAIARLAVRHPADQRDHVGGGEA